MHRMALRSGSLALATFTALPMVALSALMVPTSSSLATSDVQQTLLIVSLVTALVGVHILTRNCSWPSTVFLLLSSSICSQARPVMMFKAPTLQYHKTVMVRKWCFLSDILLSFHWLFRFVP